MERQPSFNYEEPQVPPEVAEVEDAAPYDSLIEDVQIDSEGYLTAIIDGQKVMIQTGNDGGVFPIEE